MKLLLAVTALLVSAGHVLAIECYQCSWASNTGEQAACGDPFKTPSTVRVTNCFSSSGCLKSVGKVGDINTISRGCSSVSDCKEKSCIEEICDYCCAEDKCNGTDAMTYALSLQAVLATLIGQILM